MKCKTCNQPVLYFGCKWMGAKKNVEKVFWYCFDCGLQITRFSLHNTITKCCAPGDVFKGLIMARERKIEYLRSMDFGDSIRSLDRKVITMYAWCVARLQEKHTPTMEKVNKILYNWGMKSLMIEDIDPRMRMDNHYMSYASYLDKIQTFLGKAPAAKGASDVNEVDWFNDEEGEAKLNKDQAEEAARKKYFMSLIVPKEYRERWETDRERLIQELEARKGVKPNKGFKRSRRSKKRIKEGQ